MPRGAQRMRTATAELEQRRDAEAAARPPRDVRHASAAHEVIEVGNRRDQPHLLHRGTAPASTSSSDPPASAAGARGEHNQRLRAGRRCRVDHADQGPSQATARTDHRGMVRAAHRAGDREHQHAVVVEPVSPRRPSPPRRATGPTSSRRRAATARARLRSPSWRPIHRRG